MNMQANLTYPRSNSVALKLAHARGIPAKGSLACQDCSLHKLCVAKDVSDAGLEALGAITSHPKPVRKGQHFYRQDSLFDALYIVRSGAVKTYYVNERGEEHICGFYLPGELFGVDGVDTANHRYSAQSLDTTAVCTLHYATLERQYAAHPDIQRRVTQLLCDEIFARQQPLLSLRQQPAEERLAWFLLDISRRLSQRGLQATAFSLPMSRRDTARYLGLADETMSRLFTRFQERDLLRCAGRDVSELDISALKSMTTSVSSRLFVG